MKPWIMTLLGVILIGLAGTARAADYRVTVTNLTAQQVFTPLLFVSHRADISLFQVGQPASVELAAVAEGGDTSMLAAALEASGMTTTVAPQMMPLPPGASMTVQVMAEAGVDRISVVGMLVPTNDAFVALNGAPAPMQSASMRVPAYDAGTETNDESCTHIPGPPDVCGGEGFNESRERAEGFVHIHRGIHGIADLDAAAYDWRNPVAQIDIELIPTP
jgi:hypothetical protein